MKRVVLTSFMLITVLAAANAQEMHDFYTLSLQYNQTGMYVLGGWAVSNLLTGAYGWTTQTGSTKYFHQMNTMWNLVNLSIAGFALYNFASTDISLLTAGDMFQKHMTFEKLFLINAGLDIIYMSAGGFLIHRAGKSEKNSLRYKGYGRSVIMQGAFLFAFDLVMYFVQAGHRLNFHPAIEKLSVSPGEISLLINF
jgi:hypothetical protein